MLVVAAADGSGGREKEDNIMGCTKQILSLHSRIRRQPSLSELVEDAGWVELQGICCLLVRLQSPATLHHKIESKQVYDSDCNGKVTFHDMLRALRDLSGPFMSDQQREEVLTQVLEEAGYAKDCSLVLSDFMKILGNSGLKMEVEVPVD
ncbi:hypothetical protein JHK87_004742 [Glycine soja]|nr:hypothetical protein JHK87_004742 [Glycine soja]